MTAVVDASLAAEYLLRTPLGLNAASALDNEDLVAPDILDADVLSVVRKFEARGLLTPERARATLDNLVAWDLRRIPTASLVLDAWTLRHNVSSYDALYVALARRGQVPLWTLDARLARAAPEGVSTRVFAA